MQTLKSTRQQFDFASQLSILIETYQQIAVSKMQTTRGSVLSTRQFMDGLIDVFVDLRISHERVMQGILARSAQKIRQVTVETKGKKKRIIILVTPSETFAGSLTHQVFDTFAQEVIKNDADVMVIGKLGKDYFEQKFGRWASYTYSDLKVSDPDERQLRDMLFTILEYDRIDVFNGRFYSLIEQKPIMTTITGSEKILEEADMAARQKLHFLFEPSLEEIFQFFKLQLSAALFRQTIFESRLANLGSRITALESSLNTVHDQVDVLKRRQGILEKALNNKKQQERLASIQLWS